MKKASIGFRIQLQNTKLRIIELSTTLTSPNFNEKYITPINTAHTRVITLLFQVLTTLSPLSLSTSLITRYASTLTQITNAKSKLVAVVRRSSAASDVYKRQVH